MIIGGSGQKAATLILPGRMCSHYQANVDKAVGAIRYNYTGGSGDYQVINVTGSGIWTFGYFYRQDGETTAPRNNNIVVVIDGVTVLDDTNDASLNNSGMIQVGSVLYYTTGKYFASSYGAIQFNTSLSVTISSLDDSKYVYNYHLT